VGEGGGKDVKPIQIVLGFDMETDIGSWTPFYEGVSHGTPEILRILRRQEVTATFFFTGDCARRQPEAVRAVRAAGHEVGCHALYHETVGDSLFPIPGIAPLLPDEVPLRLRRATEWVAAVAGEKPVSFRAPRLFGSTAMINALNDLGYAADATYPLYYFKERLAPYHPHRDDWTQEGGLRLLELPNFADMAMKSTDPHGRDRDQWPLFRTASADALLARIDAFIAYSRDHGVSRPFLCFYFHPWEFHPMPQGEIHYGEGFVRPDPFLVKNCGAYAVAQLERLIQQLKERGGEFTQARHVTGEGTCR
jgi:peptidoglycan/xylan/chitin deacetylase (PgdA/CDA1 family)